MFEHLNVATAAGSTIVVWLLRPEVAMRARVVGAHCGLGMVPRPWRTGASCVGPAQAPCGQWKAQSTPPCEAQARELR